MLTGVAPYRMAGTVLLVLSAWALASAAEAHQVARALEALEAKLAETAGRAAVVRLPGAWARRHRWARGYVLVGPGGIMVAAALGIANSARTGGARRRMDAAAVSIKDVARQVRALASPEGPARPAAAPAGNPPGVPGVPRAVAGYGLIVLLRRRLHPADRQRMRLLGVGVANVEHLPQVLQPLLEGPQGVARPLEREEWDALAEALARRTGGSLLGGGRRSPRRAEGVSGAARWAGRVALVVTLAGVGSNVWWFARRGMGPAALLAVSWPAWLAASCAVAALVGAGWLAGRALAARDRHGPGNGGGEGGRR